MEIDKLKAQFHEQMFEIYRRAKSEAGYPASRFLTMVTEDQNGGVDTAKRLIHMEPPSDGYTALYFRNRLNLTVEAVVFENSKWHPLFSAEDLEACRIRLQKVGYIK